MATNLSENPKADETFFPPSSDYMVGQNTPPVVDRRNLGRKKTDIMMMMQQQQQQPPPPPPSLQIAPPLLYRNFGESSEDWQQRQHRRDDRGDDEDEEDDDDDDDEDDDDDDGEVDNKIGDRDDDGGEDEDQLFLRSNNATAGLLHEQHGNTSLGERRSDFTRADENCTGGQFCDYPPPPPPPEVRGGHRNNFDYAFKRIRPYAGAGFQDYGGGGGRRRSPPPPPPNSYQQNRTQQHHKLPQYHPHSGDYSRVDVDDCHDDAGAGTQTTTKPLSSDEEPSCPANRREDEDRYCTTASPHRQDHGGCSRRGSKYTSCSYGGTGGDTSIISASSPHTTTTSSPRFNGYKTKLCSAHLRGLCTNPDCTYAHGQHELRKLPDLRKTKLCLVFMSRGVCPNHRFCTYAHGSEELQPLPADHTSYFGSRNRGGKIPSHLSPDNSSIQGGGWHGVRGGRSGRGGGGSGYGSRGLPSPGGGRGRGGGGGPGANASSKILPPNSAGDQRANQQQNLSNHQMLAMLGINGTARTAATTAGMDIQDHLMAAAAQNHTLRQKASPPYAPNRTGFSQHNDYEPQHFDPNRSPPPPAQGEQEGEQDLTTSESSPSQEAPSGALRRAIRGPVGGATYIPVMIAPSPNPATGFPNAAHTGGPGIAPPHTPPMQHYHPPPGSNPRFWFLPPWMPMMPDSTYKPMTNRAGAANGNGEEGGGNPPYQLFAGTHPGTYSATPGVGQSAFPGSPADYIQSVMAMQQLLYAANMGSPPHDPQQYAPFLQPTPPAAYGVQYPGPQLHPQPTIPSPSYPSTSRPMVDGTQMDDRKNSAPT